MKRKKELFLEILRGAKLFEMSYCRVLSVAKRPKNQGHKVTFPTKGYLKGERPEGVIP